MVGRRTPVPIDELRAVLAHVRALDVRTRRRTARTQVAAYAAFAVILAGSLRAAPPHAYLSSSPQPNEESRMRILQNLGVVSSIALTASAATAQNAVQWRVEDGGNGHWYEALVLASPGLNWVDARVQAQLRGGDLASLESASERAFATALVDLSQFSAWIGLFQEVGACEPGCGWRWVSGSSLGEANWASGEPNNIGGPYGDEDHALLAGFGWNGSGYLGRWVDWPGGTTLKAQVALIEWSADCNNDGIVDYGQIRSGDLVDSDGDWIPDCCEAGMPCATIPVQWAIEAGGNGHWYQFVRNPTDTCWTAARQLAQDRGGYLATVTSADENDFLRTLVSPLNPGGIEGGPYIGATCEGVEWGQWYWITGEPMSFMGWNAGEPSSGGNDRYVHFWRWTDLDWNDAGNCGDLMRSYLVEFDADCNGDGVVDLGQIRAGELADVDRNNIPDCCESAPFCDPCRADIDQSGAVNGVDLAAILNNWGTSGGKQPRSDVNSDGIVDGADLAEVLNSWGTCP